MTSIKSPEVRNDNLERRNLRLGLTLAALALALFLGFILRTWILRS